VRSDGEETFQFTPEKCCAGIPKPLAYQLAQDVRGFICFPLISNGLLVEHIVNKGGAVMPNHIFGGAWTERKLSVIRRYLEIYSQALKGQPFQRIYIDAFAGTGDRTDKRRAVQPSLDLPDLDKVMKGSARLALEVEPPFHRYILIERVTRHVGELEGLKSEFSNRSIEIVNADANEAISALCQNTDWRSTRGVVFLDPYGLQLTWDIAARDLAHESARYLGVVSLRDGLESHVNEIR
jgi:hypothetical protein